MAIHSIIDGERGYVHHSVSGELSLSDIQATWRILMQDSDFRPDMNVIWDFTIDAKLDMSTDDLKRVVKQLAEHRQQRGESYRLALVGRGDLTFGISRMFEGLAASLPLDIRVFRSLDDAREWLVPPPSASVSNG